MRRGQAWPGLQRSRQATAGWMLRYCESNVRLCAGGADLEAVLPLSGGGDCGGACTRHVSGALRPPSQEQEASVGPLPPPRRRRSSRGCHFGEQGPGGFP